MNLKGIKNKFSEQIYKDDLKYVLINGLLSSVLFSALLGAISFLISLVTGIRISFVFLIGIIIAIRIKKSYYNYHIWYSIIAVLYYILGYYIFTLSYMIFVYRGVGMSASMLLYVLKATVSLDGIGGCFYFFNYKYYTLGVQTALYTLLDLLIFIIGLVYAYRGSKTR